MRSSRPRVTDTPLCGTEFQVSAGYGHSCCITTEGELYTWGSNRDGCLGLPRVLKFVKSPTVSIYNYSLPPVMRYVGVNLATKHEPLGLWTFATPAR